MNFSNDILLITGSNGLLGSALKFELETTPLNCHFITRQDFDLLDKDQVSSMFNTIKPTHVIHLAARVGGLYDNLNHNYEYFFQNVTINTLVLDFAHKCPSVKKVISCLSTCIFPDKVSLPLTIDKLHLGLPHHSNLGYSYSKRLLDVQNKILFSTEKSFFGVIPSNMFGPHDNFNLDSSHVIPALIHKFYLAKLNNQTEIFIKGSGNAKRQFLYSIDASKLIIRLLNHNITSSDSFIIAPPEEYSISDIVYMIADIFDYFGYIIFDDTESDGQLKKTADSSQIHTLFPDFKYTDIRIALNYTITWFIQNYDLKSIIRL